MAKRLLLMMTLLFSLSWCCGAVAAADPHALVKRKTQAVLQVLEANAQTYESEPRALYDLVQEEILPLVDFETMAKLSLGLPWRRASPAQRQRFVDEFRTMLVRTYTTSLLEYVGAEIEYLEPRSGEVQRESYSKVYTKVKPGDGQAPIEVIYSMRKTDGEWLAYDVSLDGVSLVKNYRTNFSREVREAGLESLIERLAQRNKEMKVDKLGATGTGS